MEAAEKISRAARKHSAVHFAASIRRNFRGGSPLPVCLVCLAALAAGRAGTFVLLTVRAAAPDFSRRAGSRSDCFTGLPPLCFRALGPGSFLFPKVYSVFREKML